MYKLGQLSNGEWVEHVHPRTYEIQSTRIVAGVPLGDPGIFQRLLLTLRPPYLLLYVLHAPRGEGDTGRYQSPPLTAGNVTSFFADYGPFLASDARFDLWGHSPEDEATAAWDRHNQLYLYGRRDVFIRELKALKYSEEGRDLPFPHQHYYRAENDALARDILGRFDWIHSPLQPEDEQ